MNSKKAVVLIFSLVVVAILGALAMSMLYRSISENRMIQKFENSSKAFWLAEAGVNRALEELRNNYASSGNCLWLTSLGQGEYCVDVIVNGQERNLTAHGFIPSRDAVQIERLINVVIVKRIPPNFYSNALYSAGDLDINGDAYSVDGDVIYAGELDSDHPENITGTTTADSTISPLARLDFEQLYTISDSQGNVYDVAGNGKLLDPDTGLEETLPASFWYSLPTDPADPTTGVPNVVYIQGDLKLTGNVGTVGGFLVVVGDVITNEDEVYDTTISGTGLIDGAIYTRGSFRVNGGGTGLNVNGGVWAGQEIRLNGSADITYNEDYMTAIQALQIEADAQVTSWQDPQNPYPIE